MREVEEDMILGIGIIYMILLAIISPGMSAMFALLTPFAWLFMLGCLMCSSGREKLAKPAPLFSNFKCWQSICLLPVYSIAFSTPTLLVLSLVFHWHLAITFALGIVSLSWILYISTDTALESGRYKVKGNKIMLEKNKNKNSIEYKYKNKPIQRDNINQMNNNLRSTMTIDYFDKQ